jgi:hypothetical protein
MSDLHITGYYTLLIPFSETPTEWHPTDRTGPFATLTRGAFATAEQASAWADDKLAGQPYTVRWVPGVAVESEPLCSACGQLPICSNGSEAAIADNLRLCAGCLTCGPDY